MQQHQSISDSYQDIFELRADTYHEAMTQCPAARAREFEAIVSFSSLQPGSVVADIPSGGGYLESYISNTVSGIIAVEPTRQFYARCEETRLLKKLLSPLEAIDIADETIDAIISLAGLHHVVDRATVFNELRRILKPDGVLCIADVRLGSDVDRFLNVFVDQYNSLGHEGWFIDRGFKQALTSARFAIEKNQVIPYSWNFHDVEEMVRFCILLFGLDDATPDTVHAGIEHYLGYTTDSAGCQMNWELEFLRCTRSP